MLFIYLFSHNVLCYYGSCKIAVKGTSVNREPRIWHHHINMASLRNKHLIIFLFNPKIIPIYNFQQLTECRLRNHTGTSPVLFKGFVRGRNEVLQCVEFYLKVILPGVRFTVCSLVVLRSRKTRKVQSTAQ